MPGRDDHLNQAQHNASFYASFHKTVYSDWAATVLFYTGLHYIDAFLAAQANPQHPGKREARDKFVSQVVQLRPIAFDYFKLKNSSPNARYNPPTRFSRDYLRQLEGVHLGRIADELRQYIPVP